MPLSKRERPVLKGEDAKNFKQRKEDIDKKLKKIVELMESKANQEK